MRPFLAPEDGFSPLAARSLEEADTQFNMCPTIQQLRGVIATAPIPQTAPVPTSLNSEFEADAPRPPIHATASRLYEFLSSPLCEPLLTNDTYKPAAHVDPTNDTFPTSNIATQFSELQYLCPNVYHFLKRELPSSCTSYCMADATYDGQNPTGAGGSDPQNSGLFEEASQRLRGKRGRDEPPPQIAAATASSEMEASSAPQLPRTNVGTPSRMPMLSFKYALRGVVYHSGSLNGGHYTAACYSAEARQWLSYNDSSVSILEDFRISDLEKSQNKASPSTIEEKPEAFGHYTKKRPESASADGVQQHNNLTSYHPPVANAFMIFYERISEEEFNSIPAHKYDFFNPEEDEESHKKQPQPLTLQKGNRLSTFGVVDILEVALGGTLCQGTAMPTLKDISERLQSVVPVVATTTSRRTTGVELTPPVKPTPSMSTATAEVSPQTSYAAAPQTSPQVTFKAPGAARKKIDATGFAPLSSADDARTTTPSTDSIYKSTTEDFDLDEL